MSDPITVPVLKRLLSLQTPTALRIFEIALLLGLIVGSAYVGDQFKDSAGYVKIATGLVGAFGFLALFILIISLIGTIVKEASPRDKK